MVTPDGQNFHHLENVRLILEGMLMLELLLTLCIAAIALLLLLVILDGMFMGELLLILCIGAIALLVLLIPYWKKKPLVRWLLIVLPPSCLLPLAVYPPRDPLTMTVWMPALLFLLTAIIVFLCSLLSFLRKPRDKVARLKLIRPTLTIAAFVFAFSCHKVSQDTAIAHAVAFAKEIQKTCDQTGACPVSIDKWHEREGFLGEPNSFGSYICKLGIPYVLSYHPSEDKRTFTVYLSTGFNMGASIQGGAGRQLSACYITEGGSCEIPID